MTRSRSADFVKNAMRRFVEAEASTSAARPLSETDEAQSSGWQVRVGAVVGPLGALLLWFLPLPLPEPAHRLLAITWVVLVAWVSELLPLPVTSLLIAPALILTGLAPAKKAFASYADPILFLFVGSFFAARAMARHGLDQRFARALSNLPLVRGRAGPVRVAVLLGAMCMSMWISNTGTTAVLLPVLLGMLSKERPGQSSFAAGSVLALAHASTTGGLATLVGTPPNAIAARILADAGHHVGFLDWMKIGVPAMLGLTFAVYVVINKQLPVQGAEAVHTDQRAHEPWSRAQCITAASFGLAVLGWLLPDIATSFGASWAKVLSERLDPGAVALLASALLFIVPSGKGRQRVLTWQDAVQIEWGLILLFGGGIALGEAMFQTGLAKVLGEGLIAVTGVSGLWSLTALALVLSIALTEICSNVAAANMLVPLMIGAATQLGVSPIPPAIAAGLGASCGFALPVATGPNALVYGTGLISARAMIRVGWRIDVLSFVVLFVVLRVLCPLLGWS